MKWIIYGMILLGSLLMVYNIYGFVRYARNIRRSEKWGEEMRILNVPIFLLVMFLFGYIAVGLFGKPDLIMAAILFGGSIFVFIMYRLIDRITERIMEREHLEARLLASEESSRAKNAHARERDPRPGQYRAEKSRSGRQYPGSADKNRPERQASAGPH